MRSGLETREESALSSDLGAPVARAAARWVEVSCLALILVLASHAVPYWAFARFNGLLPDSCQAWLAQSGAWPVCYDLAALIFGLLLAIPTPRRSGLRIGTLRGHGWHVLGVCALPVLLTALVYPRLSTRPFAGAPVSMWLISPLAQDLLFMGALYGRFAEVGSARIVRQLPVTWALLATALAFAAWHVPNLLDFPTGYVAFQVAYTFVGALWTGFTRVWTGSLLYVALVHVAVNYIAWATR